MSTKAGKSYQTNPTSDKRRAVFPFRTATGTGASDVALRPLACGLSVWVPPSYRKQQNQEHQQ